MSDDYVPLPWVLVGPLETGGTPYIKAANGRVVCRAEGNIWTWWQYVGRMIVDRMNSQSDREEAK